MNLNDENLNALITKSIIDSMTPETRAELLGKAVRKLLDRDPNSASAFGDKRTFLQKAFDEAVYRIAQQTAEKELAGDAALTAQIKTLFEEAWAKATTGEAREKLVDKMAYAIRTSITGERY